MGTPSGTFRIIRHDDPDAARRDAVGGKAAALADLRRAGLPVPPWFVVVLSSGASDDTKQTSGPAQPCGPAVACGFANGRAEPAGISDEPAITDNLRSALHSALVQLRPAGEPVAVRSSARDEDGKDHSFAG